jgi:hypothetical protein
MDHLPPKTCALRHRFIYIYDGNGILYLAIGFIDGEDKLEVQNCLN